MHKAPISRSAASRRACRAVLNWRVGLSPGLPIVHNMLCHRYIDEVRHLLVRTVLLPHDSESSPDRKALILKLQLSRPWSIQPGQHVYLSLLTRESASFFQRHPHVITWWDNPNGESNARSLYLMIDPQHGRTRDLMLHPSIIDNQYAWLDGPFAATMGAT